MKRRIAFGLLVFAVVLAFAYGISAVPDWNRPVQEELARLAGRLSSIGARPSTALPDLPLVEVTSSAPTGDLVAVLLSGDGGWARIDREISAALARHGIPVVGFNSLAYFWNAPGAEQSSRALARIMRTYLEVWDRRGVVLIGFSRGADVLPFMAADLPPELRERVALVALLGPSQRVRFDFHLRDWFFPVTSATARAVAPAVERLRGLEILCFHGREETDSLCSELPPSLVTAIGLPGSHHFNGAYQRIADLILARLPPATP